MWLKPDSDWCTLNPFTKVNGNFKNQIHLSWILFPSALADGFELLHNMALASFLIHYCPVNFDEIPLPNTRDRNDKAFVVFAVGRGWVRGRAANPAPANCLSQPNSLSF